MNNILLFTIEFWQLLRWNLLHHRNTICIAWSHLRVFLLTLHLLHLLLVEVGAHASIELVWSWIVDHFELAEGLPWWKCLVLRRRKWVHILSLVDLKLLIVRKLLMLMIIHTIFWLLILNIIIDNLNWICLLGRSKKVIGKQNSRADESVCMCPRRRSRTQRASH